MKFTKAERVKLRSYQTSAWLELRPIDESWGRERAQRFERGFADLMSDPAKRHQACMIGVTQAIERQVEWRDDAKKTSGHYQSKASEWGAWCLEMVDRFDGLAAKYEHERSKLEALRSKLEATEPEQLPKDVLEHDYHQCPT